MSWNTVEMVRSSDPEWVEPVGQRSGLAFKCQSSAEVDALYARLVEQGCRGH